MEVWTALSESTHKLASGVASVKQNRTNLRWGEGEREREMGRGGEGEMGFDVFPTVQVKNTKNTI